MYKLNNKSKEAIQKFTGIDSNKFRTLDLEEIDKLIEKKIGTKLTYRVVDDERLVGRGSVYFYLNRLLDIKFINKILSKV